MMRMREQGVQLCTMALYSWLLLMSFISVGVNGDWIPKLDDTVTPAKWESLLQNFDVSTSYKTCRTVHNSKGLHKFLSIFSNKPVTYVITGDGEGKMDIKFKDSNYIFDQKLQISKERYMIVPPYQPVEWMWVRFNGDIAICAYEDSQESPDTTPSSSSSSSSIVSSSSVSVPPASGCDCASTLSSLPSTASFYAASFPRTIRKPEMPFFLTADVTPAQDDVTICTILTVDRLLRISQMSDFWGGPISAAVFLHDLSEVSVVMDWYLSNNTLRRHVDIHLVYDDKIIAFELPDRPFPVNILRNVAIRFARTANVFYIEGDFIPSPDLYPNLGPIKKRLAAGEKTAFIVAPFSSDKADFDMKLFPKDKQSLQKTVLGGGLIRDLSYFNSHAAFDFNKWYKSTEVYSMPFAGGYEPYYIGPKSYPLFEEIFIGCGADKVSHPTELNAAGFSFNVIPTGFIIHIDSTGMGSAWCRGWAGNERSTMKWEAFTTKIGNIYRNNVGTSYDSRVPWWDIAPVAVTKAGIPSQSHNEDVCEAPPPKEEKACPPCNQPAIGPDESSLKCSEDTKTKEDLDASKLKVKRLEDDLNKKKLEVSNLEDSVKALRKETERLQDYSKFVVNLSVGVVVVMIVVLGVGICIWPRGKKVWVLPTWKAEHHSL